jgi:beta-glucanase (GH16 family)
MKIVISLLLLFALNSCGKKSGGEPVVQKQSLLSITDITLPRNPVQKIDFQFTINIENPSDKEIKVNYTTVDGTANSNDYTQKSGTVTIPPNQRYASISIPVLADSLREQDKTFFVQLSKPVNAEIKGTGKGTGTIICTDGTYLPVDNTGYSTASDLPGMTLVWNEEFDGKTLNNASWNYETGGGGWGNNELEFYTNSPKNSFVTKGGYLVIEARKEVMGSNNYTSARLQTKGKKEFTYGRMDIRAKLPKGQGIWPAIWMLGSNISTTPWPASGEIDIMELLGHQPAKTYGTMHWGNVGSGSTHIGGDYTSSNGNFSDKFHVFTVIRDPAKIEWYVDDVKFYTGNISEVTGNNPFVKPFFFILNVAVGGNWPGNPDNTTVFPQRMIVDYISVFEK